MDDVVLDASALLALMNREPGGEDVEPMVPRAVMSAVNMAEVVGKLADKGLPEASIRAALGVLGVRVTNFDAEQAFEVGSSPQPVGRVGPLVGGPVLLVAGWQAGRPCRNC